VAVSVGAADQLRGQGRGAEARIQEYDKAEGGIVSHPQCFLLL